MKRRAGFTITELLVSMALIMLIMAVMAEAFTESLKAFSAMKSIGDMDQKMRAAVVILARDLSDDHFGMPNSLFSPNTPGGPVQLSTPGFPTPLIAPTSVNPPNPAPTTPGAGFFAIFQPTASAPEPVPTATDADGNPSYINTSGTNLLHFTVNRGKSWDLGVNIHPNRRESYFAAPSLTLAGLSRFQDGQNYYSQVAEVAYFLRNFGDTTPGGATRFTLFRRQAVVLTYSDTTNPVALGAGPNKVNFCDFSWGPPGSPNAGKFNKFTDDLVTPANRRLAPGIASGGSYGTNAPGCVGPIPTYQEENATFQGNDILLTDVLSFDIQVMSSIPPYAFQSVQYFDTGVASTSWLPKPPTPYTIKAVQIIIRVWDVKTQSARQITIVQDM